MKIKYLFRLIFLFILITGCSTKSYFSIDVIEPGEIAFPSYVTNLAIVDCTIAEPDKDSNNYFTVNNNPKDSIHIGIIASKAIIKGIFNIFAKSPRFKIVNSNGYHNKVLADSLHNCKSIPWVLIDSICKVLNSNALVIIENLQYSDKLTVNDAYNKGIPAFEVKLKTQIDFRFRIFDPKNKRIIDDFHQTNTYSDKEYYSTLHLAKKNIPNRSKNAKLIGRLVGENYANRITPIWTVERRMYFSGNRTMIKADSLAKAEKWSQAAEVWSKYINSHNNLLAYFATHNTAIAYEMNGDVELALEYAYKAYHLYPSITGENYINTLKDRIKALNKLKEQMNL